MIKALAFKSFAVFVVKASFTRNDFAFDWVKRYLEDMQVWDHSRVFRVSACNIARRGIAINKSVSSEDYAEHTDGQPHPVYQPAPREPELFRWRNHWISVNMTLADSGSYNDGVQVLTLRFVESYCDTTWRSNKGCVVAFGAAIVKFSTNLFKKQGNTTLNHHYLPEN